MSFFRSIFLECKAALQGIKMQIIDGIAVWGEPFQI
jgi:hypothetical protein